MDDYSSFKNYPKSLTELNADKSQDSTDWNPRDALIDLLRRMDNGEWVADAVVIVYRDYGKNRTSFNAATPGGMIEALGMLTRALYQMNDCEEPDDVD